LKSRFQKHPRAAQFLVDQVALDMADENAASLQPLIWINMQRLSLNCFATDGLHGLCPSGLQTGCIFVRHIQRNLVDKN